MLSLVVARNVVIDPPLPPSLARVASLAAGGLADKEIAHRLDASVTTVRTYMRRIYARLGVRSRAELARRCRVARCCAAKQAIQILHVWDGRRERAPKP